MVQVAENTQSDFKLLYPDDMRLWDKVRTVAQAIYGADDIMGDKLLRGKFRRAGGRRLRQSARLHRQNPVLALDRSRAQRAATWL